ncbi:MAG: 6-pyruvoyl-tetrahydropterin synthase-related protein [Ardenticatenaceae bacterium]
MANLLSRSFASLRMTNRWAVAALLLSLFAWAALLSPYYFTNSHDGRHSLFYQLQFIQGVADGQWFPRWGPDFGFGRGYPFFIFYAPLTSYTVQAAKSWGIGLVASVKISWALGFLLGAAGMFRLAKTWWRDDRAAFVATLVYTFVPYKFVDIYVRGAIAEFWSLALFPWIMLAFYHLIRRPRPATIATGGLLYAALMLTHTATALLFSPFLGAYILFEMALGFYKSQGKRKDLWQWGAKKGEFLVLRSGLAVALAIGLGLINATIFWVPLLAEQKHIDVTQYVPENYNFAIQFTEWSQFLSPFWGFGYAIAGPNDGMSFQLGLLPLLLTLLGVWLLATGRIKPEPSARLIWALVSLLVVVLAMTSLALPIWDSFPLAPMVQFPWRLLGLSAVLLALIAGGTTIGLLGALPRVEGAHPAVAIVSLLVLYGSYQYTTPAFTPQSEREETLLTILDFQREYRDMAGRLPRSEIVPQSSPMEAQYEALEPLQKFRLIEGTATIEQTYYGGSTVRAHMKADTAARIELMTYDYPGWTVYLNGDIIPHETLSPEGTIAFELPPSEQTLMIEAYFEDTPLRRVATMISLLSVGMSLLLLLFSEKIEKRTKERARFNL